MWLTSIEVGSACVYWHIDNDTPKEHELSCHLKFLRWGSLYQAWIMMKCCQIENFRASEKYIWEKGTKKP